jgi:hypothetical protein
VQEKKKKKSLDKLPVVLRKEEEIPPRVLELQGGWEALQGGQFSSTSMSPE